MFWIIDRYGNRLVVSVDTKFRTLGAQSLLIVVVVRGTASREFNSLARSRSLACETRRMSSLDPSRPEKTNGQRARAASLRSRLHRLRTDVHDVSTRAKSRDVDITIDADATAAVELVYDAYVRRIIDDAKESLATLRRANEAKVRRLTMDVRAFATTARGFDRKTAPKVWNFPLSATREAREMRGVKARVLRRVELELESQRRAKATTNDDDSSGTASSATMRVRETMYACADLVYPRRMMTQCHTLRCRAASAREEFNAEHASALAQRGEIIERLRSIDRRVCAARKSFPDVNNDDALVATEADTLTEWWDSAAMRAIVADGDDASEWRIQSLAGSGKAEDGGPSEGAGTDQTSIMHSDEGVANVLKTMMGDDIIVDETGRIDAEACDKRQDFESTAAATARIERPEFLAPSDDDRDPEELRKLHSLTGDQMGTLATYQQMLQNKRRARDEWRVATRLALRKLFQEASEITGAYNQRIRDLAIERENTEFAIVMFDLRRARIARRLHERHLAGDFDGKSDEEAARVREALSDVHRATEIVREYAANVEETQRLLDSATFALKAAQRAFRREVQDHPASSVHLDALQALYQRQDAIARTVEEAASKKIPVFPQGLDDRWWGFLVLARAKRATLERELRDAKDAHARTTEKMRALEATARELADIANRHEHDRKTAQSARWTRAYDVDCAAHLDRGYVEIPLKSTADALERDDVILVPKARIDAINAKLRESYAAKARAERANATTRDEIERVKWETRVLRLRCEDVDARAVEVALLRVSKRLQSFLFHTGPQASSSAVSARTREDISEAAAIAARLDRNARLHADKTSRERRALDDLRLSRARLRRQLDRSRDVLSRAFAA